MKSYEHPKIKFRKFLPKNDVNYRLIAFDFILDWLNKYLESFSFKTFCEKSNNFLIEKFAKFQNFKNFIFLSKMSFFDERFWFLNSAKNLATGGIPFPCQMFQQFPFRQAAGQAAGHPMIPPTSFYPPTWPYMPQVRPVSPDAVFRLAASLKYLRNSRDL